MSKLMVSTVTYLWWDSSKGQIVDAYGSKSNDEKFLSIICYGNTNTAKIE